MTPDPDQPNQPKQEPSLSPLSAGAADDIHLPNETELLTEVYRSRMERAVNGLEVPLPPAGELAAMMKLFRSRIETELAATHRLPVNHRVPAPACLILETGTHRGEFDEVEPHALLELRDPDYRSIVWFNSRLITLPAGRAMVPVWSYNNGTELAGDVLLSPRAFTAEMERLKEILQRNPHCTGGAGELEGSFLYALIRDRLAAAHESVAPVDRELRLLTIRGSADAPELRLVLAGGDGGKPLNEFKVDVRYDSVRCEVTVKSRFLYRH